MSHVASSRTAPELAAIYLSDQGKEFALRLADSSVRSIDGDDQIFIVKLNHLGHPDLLFPVTGEETPPSVPNVCSIVKTRTRRNFRPARRQMANRRFGDPPVPDPRP